MKYLKRDVMEKIDDFATKRITLEKMIYLAGKRLAYFIARNLHFYSPVVMFFIDRGANVGGGLFVISYFC